MIIDYLDIEGVAVTPHKTDSPVIVDANAVLIFSRALECFETVSRRRGQIA